MSRRTFGIGVLIAAAVFFIWGRPLFNASEKEGSDATPSSATVKRGAVETTVDVAGDILPSVQVEVKSEVGARIDRIHVKEGELVKVGQPLVDLDNTELLTEKSAAETEIKIAHLELEQAIRNFEMEEKLMQQKLITPQKFEDRTTEKKIAAHKLLRAEQNLENIETKLVKTRLHSPMAGTVLAVPVVAGQVAIAAASVSSGTLLMSIADLSALEINCHINQVDVARLVIDAPFEFTVDSLGDGRMAGRIASIAPIATVQNGIKGFHTELKIENPDPRLRPGMTADVTIPTGAATNALNVPVTAVFAGKDGSKIVYVKKADGSSEERIVKAGLSNIDVVEILSGLEENETVLLELPSGPEDEQ